MENTNNNHQILIIEDEQSLSEAIKKKFDLMGFKVFTAKSAEQGWAALEAAGRMSVVWLDHYLLGKQTGLDFLRRIREDNRFKEIPIFVVSNSVTPEKINTYLVLGAKKYYTKSNYRLDEIVSEIQDTINNEKENLN